VSVSGAAPTLARAASAIAATAYSSLLAVLLMGVATRAASGASGATGRAARLAPGTFAVLWAAHELAKLNVFLGVANPGAELLPAYLAPLRAYFGPARNSPLLAVSVAVLAAATALVARAAFRAADPARRTGLALIAGVLALAALEHALLGVRTPTGWWDLFLRWRGAP
jgi:putative photosynthetic complex assembly protein 2